MTGINVKLSREECAALIHEAQRNLRPPRDHARYLLRQALGLTETVEEKSFQNANSDAVRQDKAVAVA